MDIDEQTWDVLVVGGGAAGLAGAMALSRARRSVLVVDAGEPRNATAGHVHNYLGREGATPAELLADGRREVEGYGGVVTSGRVVSATRQDGGFAVALEDGRTVSARRLLITTGLRDSLPAIPGLAERWGSDVLHCPYCHGWEVRDQALGILGGPMGVHGAGLFRQWSADVTLFTHTGPEPTEEQREALAARGVRVVAGEVVGLEVTGDALSGIRLASGEVVPRQALVVGVPFEVGSTLLDSLGLETTGMEVNGASLGSYLPVNPMGATAVPGVFAAGNVTDPVAQVMGSAAAGTRAGASLNADLIAEETARAVEELRRSAAAA